MVKIKVCGMKYQENIEALSRLLPDYMGFIFYPKSKRYFEGNMPKLPQTIKKTGVFVDEEIDQLVNLTLKYNLQAIQLHGDESVEYINVLKQKIVDSGMKKLEIIKAFAVIEGFNFQQLTTYKETVDYFLFDTKGKEKGGNGISFDWDILNSYNLDKPYFLSGGIGIESLDKINKFLNQPSARKCKVLDVNSKFEVAPGEKDIKLIDAFTKELNSLN
ncbi:phosphoribosylanthranilate isomerase [Namhaeicola litoreus]|uniref:N-(5'-phosphoribosyl)anthranilate isomerase n=1 Tax=Namhaeicola litoreus TaxID=1052145 RepID=A0ABW3XYD9_9FLAO